MELNLQVIGKKFGPVKFEYSFKDVILYALGVGATQEELNLIFEGDPNFAVLPTFATIPITPLMFDAVEKINADLTRLLHGTQEIVLHRPIPPEATLQTYWWVEAIYDKTKAALAILKGETRDSEGVVFENTVGLFLRGQGGFGGDRGPKVEPVLPPEGQPPAVEANQRTLPIQSYLYRLNGDYNPLHASPDFARLAGFERPILHGLCTLGFATRLFIRHALGGDPRKVRRVHTRFSGVVYPGDEIVSRAWPIDDNKWVLTAQTDREVTALDNFVIETFA